MPRSFSLGRLMISITLFCVVCGVATNYPEHTVTCGFIVGHFAPTILVWLTMLCYSKRPITSSIVTLLGGSLTGLLFSPVVMSSPSHTLWDNYLYVWVIGAVAQTVGALAFGVAEIWDDILYRRENLDR